MKKLLHLFSAAPIREDHADGADLFRVLCVFLIAWFHIWQQSWLSPNFTVAGHKVDIYPFVTRGYVFVDCMLLLSGFLLMLGYLNRKPGDAHFKRRFYTSRIARILPCYLLFLAIQLFADILPSGKFPNLKYGLIDSFSHLTFTHNLFLEGYIGSKFNGVLWTLAVEVQFYLLFPYIARLFKKNPFRTWLEMVGLGFLARMFVILRFQDTSLYFNRLPAMMDVYANGMMAAVIWVRLRKTKPNALRAWISTLLMIPAFIAVGYLISKSFTAGDYNQIRLSQMRIRFPLTVAGAVILVCSGRSIVLIRKLCSNRVTRFLSGISFNFYMWHQYLACKLKLWHIPPYISETPNMDSEAPWQLLYTITCFVVPLVVSILLTYLVEKPCSKWIKRRFILDKRAKINYNKIQENDTQKG